MPDEVLDRLRVTAGQLIREIDARPAVKATTLGRWFKKRLADEDWIKSPELYTFTEPIQPPAIWKPSSEEQAHFARRLAALPPGTTSLDVLEDTLRAFERHAVGGINDWFREIGGADGYWLDKRIHALLIEMEAIYPVFERWKVFKLRRLSTGTVPDYLIDMGPVVVVLEAKMIVGSGWPIYILENMIRALSNLGAMGEVDEVMIIAGDPDIRTDALEIDVANLRPERLVGAIKHVASTGRSEKIALNLVVVPRTNFARSINLHVAYRPIDNLNDWSLEFARRSPSLEKVRGAALEAWQQCESLQGVPSDSARLSAAFLAGESWPGHPELSNNQLLLQQWLQSEVWPNYPNRVLVCRFSYTFLPVWFIGPAGRDSLDQLAGAKSQTEG